MAADTIQRLRKVAGEFNLGTATVVEFLANKGFEVENNPNAKITPEMYKLLEQRFVQDKSVKEEKEKLAEEYRGRRTKDVEPQESSVTEIKEQKVVEAIKETVVVPEKKASTLKIIDKIDLSKIDPKRKKSKETVTKEKTEPVKVKVKETVVEEKPVEIKIEAQEIKTEVAEPIVIQEKEEQNIIKGPKVLGTLDLSSMNQKTRPTKKTKKEREDEIAAKKQVSKNSSKKEIVKETAEKELPAEKETAVKIETINNVSEPTQGTDQRFIKTEIEQLTGPTVIGKIDLPEAKKFERKKVPVGTSADSSKKAKENNRKRRKRIKTEPTANATNATTSTTPNTSTVAKKPFDNNRKRLKPSPKREVKPEPSSEDISKQIKETLARLSDNTKSKGAKYRRQKRDTVSFNTQQKEMEEDLVNKSTIKVTEFVSANELANMMNVTVTDIIKSCMTLGMFVSINQRLDAETIVIVAEEFGFKVEFIGAKEIEEAIQDIVDDEADLKSRNPIVTVMGHVDHGKTSLLDYIRKTNVIAGEAGGITQHIGAYEVQLETGENITFLDTPGHEAFTAMRARGAKITDIAVIVIAADDAIMPQTKEAITHAQAANLPIIFAINKIDKQGANPDKIKESLANMNLLVEEWGGKYQSQDISAKQGTGVAQIMEKILLEAEMLDLKANPNRFAVGTILEASLDKGKGYVSKILVQNGTLKIGDVVLAGTTYGKVKAMYNERNRSVKEAGPATPVLLLGLNSAPTAGDSFRVMNDEKEARNIALKREQLQREQGVRTQKHITLDEIGRRLAVGDFKELNIIIKGDVDGSVEALSDSLIKLSTDEIQVNIIQKSVGQVNEADVMLASASNAIIVAFQVRPSLSARQLAAKEEIDIRTYSIIYNVIDEIRTAMEGMLSPDKIEEIVCSVEVRDVFKITKVGTIAGCYVLDGKINRNTRIRVIRDGIVVYTGALGSLKRFKDDVKEVAKGYECGLNIENYNDIKEGDIIEGYEEKEVKRTL